MTKSKRSLLEQMFYGDFFPSDHIQSHDPAYFSTCHQAEKEYQSIRGVLGEDARKHFERLRDLYLSMSSMDSCACFTRGFQYGALLMLEIMDAKDSLYACQ